MPDDQPSETTASQPFHVMTNPNGPTCNLECEYCFYLEKAELYPERANFRMSDGTLETFVRQYIEAQPGPEVTFAWQGGEPTLLGVDFFRTAVDYQRQYAPDDVQVHNAIQTNGTLLDEEWCEFLRDNDFLVGISIDGPRDLHNQYRRTRGDGETFDAVVDGLSLLQQYDVEHNVLCVVNDVNVDHPLEVYRFFRDNDIEWIQFIPLVEPLDGAGTASEDTSPEDEAAVRGENGIEGEHRIPDWVRERGGDVTQRDEEYPAVARAAERAPVSDRSVDPVSYGVFACEIFDEWVREDVGEVSVRLFDQCLEQLLHGESSLCVFTETCGTQVAMEHNGDVYACDHFVDPGFKRGNVHDTHVAALVDDPDQRRFGEYKRNGLPARCRSCDVREFCNGGCPKNWHLETPDGEPGLNYLCAGYRRFFTYVQPYLELFERTVNDGLPLPLVTAAVTTRDERSA